MPTMGVISKNLIHEVVRGMAHHLFHLDIVELTELPTETRRVEARQADIVLKAMDRMGEQFILHLELQNANHAQMPLRMMRYYTDIALAHPGMTIHQYVVYTGRGKLNMADQVAHPAWCYRYQLINMNALDYREFIGDGSPSALALAMLCDFKEQPAESVFEILLHRLTTLLADAPDDLLNYLKIMEFLSIDRDLESVFKIKEAEVLSAINIERMPSYQMGMEAGQMEGIKTGMQQGMQRGMQQGVKQGMKQAEEIGKQRVRTIAERMLQEGCSMELVAKTTGLSQNDLR